MIPFAGAISGVAASTFSQAARSFLQNERAPADQIKSIAAFLGGNDNTAHRRLSESAIITTDCNTDAIKEGFSSGFGKCATYVEGMYNHGTSASYGLVALYRHDFSLTSYNSLRFIVAHIGWCTKDADKTSGCLASQTCDECGVQAGTHAAVLGPGDHPLKFMDIGACDAANWQTITTYEACVTAKWKEVSYEFIIRWLLSRFTHV